MYSDYPNLRNQRQIEKVNSLILFFRKTHILKLAKTVHFNLDDQDHQTKILTDKFIFCDGWHFRSFATTIKYRTYYQYLFNPDIDKQYFQDAYLRKTNADEVIIGVHIRRTDYKYFTNGIYYYNNGVYINKIQQLIACLNTNIYKILLLSNDHTLSIEEFKRNFKNVFISKESETVDHFLMSKCDYIIGPPSTFSLWASYIGETPFYHIKNTEDKISLDKFSVCNG
jgi:hypothetical protein